MQACPILSMPGISGSEPSGSGSGASVSQSMAAVTMAVNSQVGMQSKNTRLLIVATKLQIFYKTNAITMR